jgi:glycosyltransferase involved in cell wall biosynthesis
MSSIRVLQVSARFFPDMGGTETHVYETARRLNVFSDLAIDVLTTDPTRRRPVYERVANIPIIRVPAYPRKKDYYIAPGIASFIRRGGYDLVHCQGIHNAVPIIAMSTCRRLGIPYILTPHTGGHSSRPRHLLRSAQWRAIGPLVRHARKVICVAKFEIDIFRKYSGVATDHLVTVPNGITIEKPVENARPDPDSPMVVCVGRLEKYKGQHHLIAAMPALLEIEHRARLVLVGRGPYEAALRAQAKKLGVDSKVTFMHLPPSERGAMTDLLARANVISLLSSYEAHPVAVMEAVALGRPVVVAPNAGLGELARSGVVTSVPDPADAVAVARALYQWISMGDEGPSARRKVEAILPTWDDCADAIAAIYRTSV